MRASIRDVAEQAGVSAVTVSNVLRGRSGRASSETRKRVIAAARQLNYMPVAQPATQSRHVETRIIGLVFDNIEQDDYWGSSDYRGLREGALQHGYDLLTLLRSKPDWMLDKEELNFLDRRSDGFVFVNPHQRFETLQALVRHRIPCVACYSLDVPDGVVSIAIDDAGAMIQATQLLIARGHRRILHLAGPQSREDFRLRAQGFGVAMQSAGLEPHVLETVPQNTNWHGEALAHMKQLRATAAVCASDHIAWGVWQAIEADGLRVPDDFSLTGMDDFPPAAALGLTTLRCDRVEVGRAAVEALIHVMLGKDTGDQNQLLPVELVERTSVATAR